MVACTKYCADLVPAVRDSDRHVIADSWTANAAEILAAKPDFVIAAVPYREQAIAEVLKAGVRFLALAPRTLQDIYTDIAMIASLVGAHEEGGNVISKMQADIEDVRRKTATLPKKRVFCEEWGKPIIASQPWVAELVRAAGGEFVGDPGRPCAPDDIRCQDPEVIVAAWCGTGDRVPLAKIVAQRGWALTCAVRNQQVYCISDECLNTPAPTLIDGLHALAAAIHPDVFGPASHLRAIPEVMALR